MTRTNLTLLILSVMLFAQPLMAQPPGPVKPKAGIWFTITYPSQSNKALTASSNAVVLEAATNEASYWKLIPMPDQSFRIFNKKEGKFLTSKSANQLEKLSLTDKPDDYSDWWISPGSGMSAKYMFIRNKTTKLFPVKDPDGTDAVVQSTGDMGANGKFFSIQLTDKRPAN